MNCCFVYHIFSDKPTEILSYERCPIIFSILTLRKFHPHIKIFVLDMTPENHIWGDFPKKLNFKIIDNLPKINDIHVMLNKVLHVNNFLNIFPDKIIYCDADIFWKSKPLIPETKKFLCQFQEKNGLIRSNSGFYFFQKNTEGQDLFQNWVLNIEKIKNKTLDIDIFLKKSNLKQATDESVLSFTIQDNKYLAEKYEKISLVGKNFNYIENDGYHILSDLTVNKKSFILGIDDFKDNFINNTILVNIPKKNNKSLRDFICNKKIKLIKHV